MKIVNGIYRVADMTKDATLNSIKKAIRTDPNYLLNTIAKCNLVTYRNIVTDMDSMLALKFTYKGVSGLGEKSNDSIPVVYRMIHPSHVGKVDLDSSSDTNPGMTGTICPFTQTYDGFFSDYSEPNYWETEFKEVLTQYNKVSKLQEIFEFEEKVNGVDRTEAKTISNELAATMQQIIDPILFANEGEVFTVTEEDIYGY
jgi:hypothetical protein